MEQSELSLLIGSSCAVAVAIVVLGAVLSLVFLRNKMGWSIRRCRKKKIRKLHSRSSVSTVTRDFMFLHEEMSARDTSAKKPNSPMDELSHDNVIHLNSPSVTFIDTEGDGSLPDLPCYENDGPKGGKRLSNQHVRRCASSLTPGAIPWEKRGRRMLLEPRGEWSLESSLESSSTANETDREELARSQCVSPSLAFSSNRLQRRTTKATSRSRSKTDLSKAPTQIERRRRDFKAASVHSTVTCDSTDSGIGDDAGPPTQPMIHYISMDKTSMTGEKTFGGQARPGCSEESILIYLNQWRGLSEQNVGDVYCNEMFAMATLDTNGGFVHVYDRSAVLKVPPNALTKPTLLYFAVMYDEEEASEDQEYYYASISPSFECGPDGTTFLEPATLTFSHCLEDVQDESAKHLVHASTTGNSSTWDEEDSESVALLDSNTATLTFDHFSRHKLSARLPRSRIPVPQDTSRISKLIYICSFVNADLKKMTVYFMNKDNSLYENIKRTELENGSAVNTVPNPLVFKHNRGPLVLRRDEGRQSMPEASVMEVSHRSFDFLFFSDCPMAVYVQQGAESENVLTIQAHPPMNRNQHLSQLRIDTNTTNNVRVRSPLLSGPMEERLSLPTLCTSVDPQENDDTIGLSASYHYNSFLIPTSRPPDEGCECQGACNCSTPISTASIRNSTERRTEASSPVLSPSSLPYDVYSLDRHINPGMVRTPHAPSISSNSVRSLFEQDYHPVEQFNFHRDMRTRRSTGTESGYSTGSSLPRAAGIHQSGNIQRYTTLSRGGDDDYPRSRGVSSVRDSQQSLTEVFDLSGGSSRYESTEIPSRAYRMSMSVRDDSDGDGDRSSVGIDRDSGNGESHSFSNRRERSTDV